ncbi:uncharacterized protein LY89DRAFT_228270 [Mollisia scopiformis]|uniref:Uncharacterized protein n=1 Tax=Mollisia scopiformis TaxID=149040 RepID=A0A194WUG8_MOLSC|nr:uncharacterized protein LY89DRAFT_228270 [Mollisia scopiformis]KUJ11605.1 hypothetical protein LY89DRAFT_228270 [Mollisia scopiformis]
MHHLSSLSLHFSCLRSFIACPPCSSRLVSKVRIIPSIYKYTTSDRGLTSLLEFLRINFNSYRLHSLQCRIAQISRTRSLSPKRSVE